MPRGSGKYILVWIDFDLEKKKKIITLSNPIDFLEIENQNMVPFGFNYFDFQFLFVICFGF